MNEINRTYDFVFRNMRDGICIMSTRGIVQYVNGAAAKMFQFPEEELVGKRMWQMIPSTQMNDDFIQLFITAVTEKRESHEAIVKFEKNDGSRSTLRVCVSYSDPGLGAQERAIIVILTDLTELFRVSSAFARYTSKEIAEQVLNTPQGEAMGGQTSNVTILMSDLRGFTAMSTHLSAQELITLLNHYFAQMNAAIEQYGGTVIEFLGDGIFAVFGAPKKNEAHAASAVACALEMQNRMKEVNKWNAENGFPALSMGIGINTGAAVVGNIGSESRTKYGCMGENVNLAGRCESFTIGGQIYVSERTVEKIGEPLTFAGQQKFLPKGAKAEMTIYDVTGIGGEYQVSFDRGGCEVTDTKRPGEVLFQRLDGKSVSAEHYRGTIVALSETYGRLKTDEMLHKSDNLMLEIGGNLYAKVTQEENGSFLICFTAKPDSFGAWSSSLLQ